MQADLTATLTAMAPIAHGSFSDISAGNLVCFRRIDAITRDGRICQIPVVSTNSLRGILRRIVMRDLFDRAGLDRQTMAKDAVSAPEVKRLTKAWDRLYGALANGGHFEKMDTRTDPEATRALRAALPPLSLFGAGLFSSAIEGRLKPLGMVWPLCKELGELGLYDGDTEALPYGQDLISEVGLVRHVDREYQIPEESGVTPMPTTTETLITGTRLLWRVRYAGSATALERSIIPWALEQLRAIGGKHNVGFGAVDVEHDGDASLYQEWLDGPEFRSVEAALRALADKLK